MRLSIAVALLSLPDCAGVQKQDRLPATKAGTLAQVDRIAQAGDAGFVNQDLCGGVHQPKIPVRIYADPIVGIDWLAGIGNAIEWWGPVYFSQSFDETEFDVFVTTSTIIEDRALTLLQFSKTTCVASYTGIVLPVADIQDRQRAHVVAHELGHVLGLAHDTQEASLMYPTSRTETLPYLSDTDWLRLLIMYEGD